MSAAKGKAPASDISRDQLLRFYRQMVAIRLFEERVNDLYTRALMPGLAHLYIGEEAIAVGVCEALRRDDYVTSTHRGHGHCLAKGADSQPDVRGAARQGSRLLQGQGRVDAHRRPRHRQSGRQRHRGRQRRHRHGRGVCLQVPQERPRGRVLLRRRRAGAGAPVRGDEPGAAVEAAGDLRVREQRLQRVHALLRVHRGRRAGARPGLRHRHRDGRRPERARGQQAGGHLYRARPARRGAGVPRVQDLSLPRAPRGRHRPRLLPAEGRGAGVGHHARPDHAARRVADVERRGRSRDAGCRSRKSWSSRWTPPWSLPSRHRIPTRSA